ncbi:DUF2786 domain-containing protein [Tissierella sp. MSJ-40]|uniref:DUF2786 domain-containing protein n=1 Tax=Tissierella simiarum TaxID=2841534 RepID=A0ABS6E7N7_9FIRM|nr:DUF2786 domain-containing protein [Tissierella simiarum]MBU5438929.1 DUF2786 domain-containing protein [Tissierella simiarum]
MENIILKIKKLLSLGESNNKNEAEVALLKAQELLVKHKLSLKEIEENETENLKVIKKKTNVTFRTGKWKGILAGLIADNFNCYCYYNTRYSHRIVFLGKEEDVSICELLLTYAIDTIESTCKRLAYKYSKNGYSVKGLTNDYALGFIDGLYKQFERQKRENQEWGIMLVKDKEVQEEYDNINFDRVINSDIKVQGFSELYVEGLEDGENFKINNRVEGKEEQQIPMSN